MRRQEKRRRLLLLLLVVVATVTSTALLGCCFMVSSPDGMILESVADHLPSDDPRVLAELKQWFLDPPSTLPYNLSTNPHYLATSRMGTWPFIHKNLRQLFSEEREGFFVEAGALDGQQLSNTLWLEQELKWTGLLVEPDPFSYEALRAKHRKAWTSKTCPSQDNFVQEVVHVSAILRKQYFSPWKWHLRGASYQLGVNRSAIFDTYLQTADQTYTITTCFPLISYLLALNVTTVDFLSLDTQGTEIGILKSLPWSAIAIRVIIVEIEDSTFDPSLTGYMNDRGYVLITHETDYIYVKEGDPVLSLL
ncbi:uncharacterized protein [Panulirus ornatus]|uniref:uncharacterized protein n=1 Tax=Panulirus ornatus TaxID=150431 RepID=UPI003A87DFFC